MRRLSRLFFILFEELEMKLFLVVVLLAFASADTIVSDNGVLPGNSFNSGQGVPIIVPSLNPQVFPGFQVPNGPIQSRSQFVVRTIQVLEPVPLPMQQSLSLTTMVSE